MENSKLTFEQQLANPKVIQVPVRFKTIVNGTEFIIYNNRLIPPVESKLGYTVEAWYDFPEPWPNLPTSESYINLEGYNYIVFHYGSEYSYDLFELNCFGRQLTLKPIRCTFNEDSKITYLDKFSTKC